MAKKLNLKKFSRRSEEEEQKSFVRWLEMAGVLYTAVLNENILSFLGRDIAVRVAAKAKVMGKKRGIQDILIFEPRHGWCGCFIEMKRADGGNVKDEQEWFRIELLKRGYYACICYGKDEAIQTFKNYWAGKAPNPL